jgi:hypothetical protein
LKSFCTGYEYDIFISYRHNDNRSGWVSEFITAETGTLPGMNLLSVRLRFMQLWEKKIRPFSLWTVVIPDIK